MSDDVLFIVRDKHTPKGAEQYYYSSTGAFSLDFLLLQGPQAALQHIKTHTPTPKPVTHPLMEGAVLIDLENQSLLYWATQFYAGPTLQRYYRLLLQQQWPHWEVRWALRAINSFADALGQTFPEQRYGEQRAQKKAYKRFVDQQERNWQQLQEDYQQRPEELAMLITQEGEERVRFYAEQGHHVWVTVCDKNGQLADFLLNANGLCVGPELLDYLHQRKPLTHFAEYINESTIRECVFLQEGTREIFWWKGFPDWLDEGFWCEKYWEGWRISQHDGGSRHHLQLSKRSPDAIRSSSSEAYEILKKGLEGTADVCVDRQKLLVCLVSRLLGKEVEQALPEGTLHPVPNADLPDEVRHALYALIETH